MNVKVVQRVAFGVCACQIFHVVVDRVVAAFRQFLFENLHGRSTSLLQPHCHQWQSRSFSGGDEACQFGLALAWWFLNKERFAAFDYLVRNAEVCLWTYAHKDAAYLVVACDVVQ